MRMSRLVFYRGIVLAMGLVALGVVGGCGSSEKRAGTANAVFFPPAPEKPRLQFLKSFSSPADLGAPGPSGFEQFVLGEPEQQEGIATPYGMAVHEGKLYVCDVAKRRVEVLDLRGRSFGYMTEDRRLRNPVNIAIEGDGTKYVADPSAGAVFVFDAGNTLRAILGKELGISPRDVAVRGASCYVTDLRTNDVVVLDKTTGREIRRISYEADQGRQKQISDVTFGPDGDLYVTDRFQRKIFRMDASGTPKGTIGRYGDNVDELVMPKGVAVDRENRIWVVDAGVAVAGWSKEVINIYDEQGRFLLFFGRPGSEPGNMNMPATVVIDYDTVDLFEPLAVRGAQLEFLVFVTNQYGPHKVNVYGFGRFPVESRPQPAAQEPRVVEQPRRQLPGSVEPPATRKVEPPTEDGQQLQRMKEIAEVYYRSMDLYRAGRLEQARAGFRQVIESGLIPPPMEETLKGYIRDIDVRLRRGPAVRP